MSKNSIQNNSLVIYAFIDFQNLIISTKNDGWGIDFKRFYIYLKDKYKTDKIFLFLGYIKQNEYLYKSLRSIGYYIILKPTLPIKYNNKIIIKGNVDAELVLHSMIQYGKYDKAIIISGDGDFYCLIEYLEGKNKLNKLLVPNEYKYSKLLRKFHAQIDYINRLRKKIGLN